MLSRPPAQSSWQHPIRATLRAAAVVARDLKVALGVVLLAGAGVAAAGTWAFLELAEVVGEGTLQELDETLLRRVGALDAPWLAHAMREITALGNVLVVFTVASIAALFLWLTRHRYSAALLVASTLGGVLVNGALKAYFARPRPEVIEWGTQVASPSFPSGHATAAAVVYATVAYLAARLQRRRLVRVLTLAIATLVIVLIAASRVALGVHYPTDVIAGMMLGLAWAAFCMAVLEAVQRFIVREAPAERVHEEPAPKDDGDTAPTSDPPTTRADSRPADREVERASAGAVELADVREPRSSQRRPPAPSRPKRG